MKKILFIYIFYMCSLTLFSRDLVKISIVEDELDKRNNYYIQMLTLALDKTVDSHGPYDIVNLFKYIPQNRISNFLTDGRNSLDVMWTMTNIEREELMLPVRIPLLKGLMGARLIILNKENRDVFKNIDNIDELRAKNAIQGHDWPDTDILAANGFRVERATNYDGMFLMLHYNRGDYFPRAINEPFQELELRPHLNLAIDKHIMLYYFSPIFFFVNRKRPELRNRIERGLEIAIADGSFDELFYNFPANKEMLERVDFSSMKIFRLYNPFLTEETRALLDRKELIIEIK